MDFMLLDAKLCTCFYTILTLLTVRLQMLSHVAVALETLLVQVHSQELYNPRPQYHSLRDVVSLQLGSFQLE
jgi:hypothetical protein